MMVRSKTELLFVFTLMSVAVCTDVVIHRQ